MEKYQVEFHCEDGSIRRCIVKAYNRYRALLKAVVSTSIRDYSNVRIKMV